MSDTVFKVTAKKLSHGKIGVSFWTPSGILSYLAFNDDAEWAAFRSLLIPSAKADIIITELDENGKRI